MFKSFKGKIFVPSIGIMALALASVVAYTSMSIRSLTDDLAEERATMISQSTHLRFDELTDISALSTRVVAQSDILADALENYAATGAIDRKALLAYLEGRRTEIGAGMFLMLDTNGTTIIRTILPAIFGDSQAASPNVQAALRGETVSAFSVGAGAIRMAVSTYTPITSGLRQIGVFIARTIMNEDAFVDTFAEVFNAHVSLYAGTEIIATTLRGADGSRLLGGEANPLVARAVLEENQVFRDTIPIDGVPHHMYAFPIHNAAGVPIGMFSVAFSNERTIAATMEAQRDLIIISVIGLLVMGIVLSVYIKQLTKPVILLAQTLKDSADGVVTERLPEHGDDEIAGASRSFNKTMEERLEILEERNRAKNSFLARMSHEVRTPLNAVMGITEIQLQKGVHSLDTEEAFLRIYNSSKLLLGIINDILDLSKVEAGKMEIVSAEYETASMIVDTVQLNLIYAENKQIDFSLDVDENLPLYLVGDELRVKQILNNILSNAFKYTQEGMVALTFGVDAGRAGGEVALVIKVTDTGQGMTKEQIDKLFDVEFTRFNIVSNRGIEGSGLGMSITHSLLKMMGGSIKVESEPGKGSSFTVRIPQKQENNELLGRDTAESLRNLKSSQAYLKRVSLQHREPMPYGRVLVVDDVETNLYVIKGLLLPYKLAVETVESAAEAITRVKNGQLYDIIFMDHMMPGMDGVEAAKILLGLGYDRPIVALTANATVGAAQMFMDNGFSGFISKPIDPAKLDACLIRFIRGGQPAEALEAAQHPAAKGGANADAMGRLKHVALKDIGKALSILEPLILRQEMDDDAYKMYVINTHAMKSSLFNVGRAELSREAAILEEAGRGKDGQTIQKLTPPFLDGLREIIREFSQEGGDDAPECDDDPVFLRERLLAISDTCKAYNIRSASNLLSELRSKPSSRQTKILLDKIDDYLILGEFEDAAETARQAAAMLDKPSSFCYLNENGAVPKR